MGLFDIFSNKNANQAAQDQINALAQANTQGQNYLSQGYSDINNGANTAYAPLNTNFSTDTGGANQLASLLGFGPGGAQSIDSVLKTLPGYQFTLDQGTQNVLRQNAAQGFGTGPGGISGNTLKDLTDYSQGLASTNYNQYVSQLQPFLTNATNTGGQIANTAANFANLGNANRTTAANMVYGTDVGQGNAEANAVLANNTASANGIGALLNGAKLATSLFSMLPTGA